MLISNSVTASDTLSNRYWRRIGLLKFPLWVFVVFASVFPSTALAHNVNVFAYVEGDTVVTESYFSDGRKCRDCTIEVFDGSGKKFLDGKTDTEGQFSFDIPAKADLVIRLTASMGHMAEYTLSATELPGGKSEELPPPDEGGKQSLESTHSRSGYDAIKHDHSETASESTEASLAEIERAVDRAVSRQLLPIRKALEESKRKQRFSDIVGGIGYIVGLMGLMLYFYSRQRKKE